MDFEKLPDRIARFAYRLMGVKPKADPRKSETPLFATFHDRLFASGIDVALIFLLFGDLFRWISATVYQGADQAAFAPLPIELRRAPVEEQTRAIVNQLFESGFFELWLLNSFIQSLVMALVLVPVWWQFHQTPGKWIIGLRLAGKDGEGTPVLRQYIRRYLGFYISLPVLMVGFAALAFDKKKRAWHDHIAGTTVIYSKEGSIFRRGWDWLKAFVKNRYGKH